jgi:hypothetical protein
MKFSMAWALVANIEAPAYVPRVAPEPHKAGPTPPCPLVPWQTEHVLVKTVCPRAASAWYVAAAVAEDVVVVVGAEVVVDKVVAGAVVVVAGKELVVDVFEEQPAPAKASASIMVSIIL